MIIREIQPQDDPALFQLVRSSLKSADLAIPGTAYFDESIKAMSQFYLNHTRRQYFVLADETERVLGDAGFAEYNGRGKIAELQKLYLAEEAKGKGYGTLLTQQLVSRI